MDGAWGRRLPRGAVRMLVVSAVATAGLLFVAPAADAERTDVTVSGYGVRVRVFSQMCDNGFQHTRVNVRNLNGHPVTINVSDPRARTVNFGSSGVIPAGHGKAVSITASPNAPARTATVIVDPGGEIAVPIPFKDCCPDNPDYPSCLEVAPATIALPPPIDSTPVSEVLPEVTTEVESGTLPFTGADVRFISAAAAVLVLLGGAFMLIQARIDSQKTLLVGEELTRRGIFGPY